MAIPATLIDSLRSGKIIPFVGAGVSRAVRCQESDSFLFPSWKELLENAALKLDQENKTSYGDLVRNLISIDKPDFLAAAKYAQENLGANWYAFLSEQINHPRSVVENSSLQLASAIWKLGSKLVVTTNYDRVLAWASDQPDDLSFWNIESPAEQAAMMRNGLSRPVVWHLHGRIDDAAKLILTPDGYSRLYPSANTEQLYLAAFQSLRFLLTSHSLLFVGFSFADSAFGMTLRGVHETYAGANGPHYALIHQNDIEAARNATLHNVELVPFEDYGESLIQTIKDLASYASLTPIQPDSICEEKKNNTTAEPALEPFDDTCDTPPPIGTWVGRAEELAIIADRNLKIVTITGIGGQGKSTLVAKYLETVSQHFDICDWRDCKEQDNAIHTHLVRIIERLTKGRSRARDLASERIESVIRLFLSLAHTANGLFIFDNIDRYVDISTSQATKGMHLLIQGALKSAGSSRFLFTTRPKLKYDDASFMQIELDGLSIDEARSLFEARNVQVDPNDLEELHALLQGHPLWIGLIANQVLAKRINLRDLIFKIKEGKEASLPTAMLREIWSALKLHQQKLLRYLAEMVRPETEKQIQEFTSPDLTRNQFRTTLNHLKSLDLVVVKSPPDAPDTIELHPLVREFIRRHFSKVDRTRYIEAIMLIVDRAIEKLRPTLAYTASFDIIQNWSTKVELLVNAGEFREALLVLEEATDPLVSSGFSESFVHLTYRVLSLCEWNDSTISESLAFENVCEELLEVLSQLGRFDDAEEHLRRYALTTSGATARYISICRLRAYFYWSQQKLELAKEWGQRGVELKTSSQIDTRHDCGHDLALAQRDSGDTESALKYFLNGEELATAIEPGKIENSRKGEFYGNIGRTLYYMGKDDEAMSCLVKSAWLLERERAVFGINLGWAAFWLGELLERKQDYSNAYMCFRRAAAKWKTISPYRGDEALESAKRLADSIEGLLSDTDDLQIENKYNVWLNKAMKTMR